MTFHLDLVGVAIVLCEICSPTLFSGAHEKFSSNEREFTSQLMMLLQIKLMKILGDNPCSFIFVVS